MGHRHSPEEVGRAGRVCACDGGFVAAGAESVAVEQQVPHPQTTRVRDDKSDFFRSLLVVLGGFFFGVGDEFFVGAFEVVDFAVAEMPDAGGDLVDYVVVVGDEEDGAVVALERDV